MRKALLLVIILFIVWGCDSLKKKEEMEELLPPLEVPPSYLSFRVNFPAGELESGLNRVLPKILIDDALPLKDPKDTLFLKLIRKGDLTLAVRRGIVEATIPLDVSASVKKKVFGITFSNEDTPILLTGTIKASAEVRLYDDWELDIICEWQGFDWVDQPKISLGGFTMDISDNVDAFLADHTDLLSDVICGAIHQSVSFSQVLDKVWLDIQEPMRIRTARQDLWLHSQPVALSGQTIPKEDTITLNLEYRTILKVATAKAKSLQTPLPNRTVSLNDQSAFLAYPEFLLPYKAVEQALLQELKDQSFTYEGYEVSIEDVSVAPKGQVLSIVLDLSGDVEGQFTLTGKPQLNDNLELSLADFKYRVGSGDDLLALTDLAVHYFAEEYVAAMVKVDVRPLLEKLDKIIVSGVSKSDLGEKLSIDLDFKSIRSYQMRMTEGGIQWIFFIEGSSALNLKRNLFKPVSK